jgi:hypothetical protein
VEVNDITVLVSGEQKHYFHLWGLEKQLVAFATCHFFRPHSMFLPARAKLRGYTSCFVVAVVSVVVVACLHFARPLLNEAV